MRSDRARFAAAHIVAWIGWGLAVGLAWQQGARAPELALVAAGVALLAGISAAVPVRVAPARHFAIVMTASLLVAGVIGVAVVASPAPGAVAMLPLAAGVAGAEPRAAERAAARDIGLSPIVRPAPTFLALAIGFTVAAVGASLQVKTAWMLAILCTLLAAALAMVAQLREPAARADPPAEADAASAARTEFPRPRIRFRARGTWLILAATAAGAAIVALRPALSATGGDHAMPAAAAAVTLATGGLLGPPLAMAACRMLPAHAVRVLVTLAGACALAAPLARSGAADLVVSVFLGAALAALVAQTEVARRSRALFGGGVLALLPFAAAAGALLAAALLAAVPVTDVVLGASIVCVVIAIGVWVPTGADRATTFASARPS